MPFDDFTQFLQASADAHELERITVELSGVQEVSALTLQICQEFQECSPVLLFENVAGSSVPVVTNILGNRQRFFRALGVSDLSEVMERLQAALNPFPPARDWSFGLTTASQTDRGRFSPKVIRRAPCQQVIKLGKDLDLHEFPILQSWPGETGPAITAGQLVMQSPEGKPIVQAVPVEMLDGQTLQIHWEEGAAGQRLWQSRLVLNHQTPVAISLGGDPLLSYVASLPLPPWLDPWTFAGILRNEGLNLIRARSVELNVPADAEIVLEGYLDPVPGTGQGCLLGRDGTLQARSALPLLRLSAITHRANPLFPATAAGPGFHEDFVCGELTERLLLSLLQLLAPDAVDLHLPRCGAHRDAVFVSCQTADPAQVQRVLQALGSLPVTSTARLVVAVGPGVNVRDADAVWHEVILGLGAQAATAMLPIHSGHGRLVIDAVAGMDHSGRAAASPEVLARLGQMLGNPRCEISPAAVERTGTG